MINIKHLLTVTAAWMTIVFIVCFGGVALLPGILPWFMQYALHMSATSGERIVNLTTFFSGLVIWNLIALFTVWLFAFLFTKIKH